MTETTPTPKPKALKAPAAPADPAEALKTAIETIVAAAEAYAKADTDRTTHSFSAGDFRARFQGGQLLSLARA